jgi:hypothetical protein
MILGDKIMKKLEYIFCFSFALCLINNFYVFVVSAPPLPIIDTWGQKLIALASESGEEYAGLCTVSRASNGNLIASYIVSSHHNSQDSRTVYKISTNNGNTWGSVHELYDDSTHASADPEMVLCPNGKLLCFVNLFDESSNDAYPSAILNSTDNGTTWNFQEYASFPNEDAPCGWGCGDCFGGGYFYTPFTYENTIYVGLACYNMSLLKSIDNGSTFTLVGLIKSANCTQTGSENSIMRLQNGSFVCIQRDWFYPGGTTPSPSVVYYRMSTDGGVNWFNVSDPLVDSDKADPMWGWLDDNTIMLTLECNWDCCDGVKGSYFYISSDNGSSWENKTLLKQQTPGDDYQGWVTLAQRTGTPLGGIAYIVFANGQKIYGQWVSNNQSYMQLGIVPQIISIDGGINGLMINNSNPMINWTIVNDATRYELQISTSLSFSESEMIIDISNINETNYPSYYDENSTRISFVLPSGYELTENDKYYCRVKAYE